MLTPELAIIIMFVASVIIGYYTMPIILGFNSPNIRYHTNKVLSSLLMGFLMAIVELFMHSNMLSLPRIITYFSILWLCTVVLYYAIKNQWFVDERAFLNGMIEHHAMGIAMAYPYVHLHPKDISNTNAKELNKLAIGIYDVQTKEIKQMDTILRQMPR
jgi:peptidoglycan/LPS O-acetylase OafA/YrhL